MSKPPLNILITQKADNDEENIYKYIAQKFGKQTLICSGKIINLSKALALRPFSRRPAKNNRTLRVYILNRQNKVMYKFTDTEVIIIRILDTKTETARRY